MLKLENSIRGLSFSRVAFDLTIQANNKRMGVRRGNELKGKILNQMGCPSYIEWKSLLMGDILFEL